MAAFSAGDYGRAEQLFNAFETRHPSDARVEDATFLKSRRCSAAETPPPLWSLVRSLMFAALGVRRQVPVNCVCRKLASR
jgi:hypothetical protein